MKHIVNAFFLLSLFVIIILVLEDYKKDDTGMEKAGDFKYLKDGKFTKIYRENIKKNNKKVINAQSNILEILDSARQSMQAIKYNLSMINISMPNSITKLDSLNDFLDEFSSKINTIKNNEGLTGNLLSNEIKLKNVETRIKNFNAVIKEANKSVIKYRVEHGFEKDNEKEKEL